MKQSPLRHRTGAFTAFILCAALPMTAGAVNGTVTSYASPGRINEHCVILDRMPGGVYSDADKAREQAFCSIDFYAGSHALCPKVFSTSPGTLVYDISRGPFAGKANAFEDQQCATSSPVKRGALGEPVSYKMTMNDAHTSATFATASLLYYHFSRFFDTDIHVPVSVYRSMDKDVHLAGVTQRGVEVSAHRKGGAMNHAGWTTIQDAERNPATYHPTDELFTQDRKQVHGILLHPHGDRYNAEINGTRKSGWGKGQNRDFQETAPFLALRSDQPLQASIEAGIHEAAGKQQRGAGGNRDPSPGKTQAHATERQRCRGTTLLCQFHQKDRDDRSNPPLQSGYLSTPDAADR